MGKEEFSQFLYTYRDRDEYLDTINKHLSFLPKDVKEFASKHIIFVVCRRSVFGLYVNLSTEENLRAIIFIKEEQFSKQELSVVYSIAHEVAHAYKDHKHEEFYINKHGSLLQKLEYENEAIRLAEKWLSPHFEKAELDKVIEPAIKYIKDELSKIEEQTKK